MLVTGVEQQKKDTAKYSIFVEGEYVFSLCATDVAYFKIKEGAEISETTFSYLLDSLTYIKAQDTAMKYLGYKARTVKEVERRLREKEYSDTIIKKVLNFLERYGYTNDRTYCDAYIKESIKLKPKGEYLLKRELKERGVQEDIIEQALAAAGLDQKELAQTIALLRKKTKGKLFADEKEKQRAIAFLCRRGYRYDVILEAIREVLREEDFS